MTEELTPREKTRREEMNPDLNPLIPGGRAYKEMMAMLEDENTPQAERLREMSDRYNCLLPTYLFKNWQQ